MKFYYYTFIFTALLFAKPAAKAQNLQDLETFEISGISSESKVMRRDPSDIILVDGVYYVWYSRREAKDGTNLFPGDTDAANGYHADIWYATSRNKVKWKERGLCISKGNTGAWDEQSAFTPNILVWNGKYYLYYTGVPKPFTNQGDQVTKSAIGIAVADSPKGPWKKMEAPILQCSDDPKDFDSMRVDDACLIVFDGKIFLYYKGRQWNNIPINTKTGLAVADNPMGPYIKNASNPIINAGHEVMMWPLGEGVASMINIGPKELRRTLNYSEDGINFTIQQHVEKMPSAGGFYRPEAFTNSDKGKMPEWGIEIVHQKGLLPGLGKFELLWGD